MNVKKEFIKWFSPKAPDSYKAWFRKNLDEKLDGISSAYMASFKKPLFDIDVENVPKEISSMKNNIANRFDAEDKTFAEYDNKNGHGIPKAILNVYYTRFLENYDTETGGEPDQWQEDDQAVNNFTYEKDLQNSVIAQAEELFPGYKIFGDNGEGIEYNINGKRIDLLLENKSGNKLLAVELKAGAADYKTFGQISMYLGPLMHKYPDKEIAGVIIAGEINDSLKMAVLSTKSVKTMTYTMKLTLEETA
ncbi:MAG: hypothetical protein Pg6C_11860 [Treponemataceae bacterium]|nr:MAG: hypothetical protein Pg6C_11860 [Treponemataceae bacterium]